MNSDHRTTGENTIRVLVADNSLIHTHLLADALTRDPALEVVPFESDPSGLVATVIDQDIDVLVISSNLDTQPSRGLEILKELHALHLNTRYVLLLDSSKDEAVLMAFRAGARGVFGKNEPVELLNKCIRCVHEGQIWANSHKLGVALGALADSPTARAVNADGLNLLTGREQDVVHCLAEGLTNREIAKRLKLSRHTVKNYLFRIFDKLGVSNRVELLFMTLSQARTEQVSLHGPLEERHNGDGYSDHESDLLKRGAEAGLPAAQLALAQLYLTRRSDPRALVDGYMWYLVATERAWQGRGVITKRMTPQQIDEAKQKARVWLSKWNRPEFSASDPALYPKPPAGDRVCMGQRASGIVGAGRA